MLLPILIVLTVSLSSVVYGSEGTEASSDKVATVGKFHHVDSFRKGVEKLKLNAKLANVVPFFLWDTAKLGLDSRLKTITDKYAAELVKQFHDGREAGGKVGDYVTKEQELGVCDLSAFGHGELSFYFRPIFGNQIQVLAKSAKKEDKEEGKAAKKEDKKAIETIWGKLITVGKSYEHYSCI